MTLYRMVTFSMTFTPNQVFKVTAFLKSKILKTLSYGQSYYKTVIGNHT